MAPPTPGTVRIISGRHRGRRITVPEGDVRPTADRVREALFNVLAHNDWAGGRLPVGARVLDAFAGTGALGFEALSRGAAEVMFFDTNTRVRKALGVTIEQLDETPRAYVLPRDAAAPGKPLGNARYDLVLVDAPYESGLGEQALGAFARDGWLSNGAVAVVELDSRESFTAPAMFLTVDDRTYGRTRLVFLEYEGT